MGGQIGTEFEITITGQHIEGASELSFSDPGISARAKLADDGKPEVNHYLVTIADDCRLGVHEACDDRLGDFNFTSF